MDAVEREIAEIEVAGLHLAAAKKEEMRLEALRPELKAEAVARIMQRADPLKEGKQYSATAAAEVVALDPTYRDHLSAMGDASAATIVQAAHYEAARLRALRSVHQATVADFEPLTLALNKAHEMTLGAKS